MGLFNGQSNSRKVFQLNSTLSPDGHGSADQTSQPLSASRLDYAKFRPFRVSGKSGVSSRKAREIQHPQGYVDEALSTKLVDS